MQAMPGATQTSMTGLQQTCPAGHLILPQSPPSPPALASGPETQLHTVGEESQRSPAWHLANASHRQRPPQSAPPCIGSQSS